MTILSHPEITAIGPQLVYDGQRLLKFDDLQAAAPRATGTSYVYFLSMDRTPVYIGMSRNVAGRFEKHKQREWWPFIDRLTLLQVRAVDDIQAETFTRRVESLCIRGYRPTQNKAGL